MTISNPDRRSTSSARQEQGTHGEQRKQRVLTKGRASVVGSISDAIVAKDGEPFFLCQPDGQVPLDGAHGYGLYHHDCRFLSGYELALAGRHPDPLAAAEASGTTLALELTNPDIGDGDGRIEKEQLGISWTRSVARGGPSLDDEIVVRNFGRDDAEFPVELRFKAGFEDVFAIRGLLDEQPGTCRDPRWHDGVLEFSYAGGDGVERTTRIRVNPPLDVETPDGGRVQVRVAGRDSATITIHVELDEVARGDATPIERRDSPAEDARDAQGRRAGRGGRGTVAEAGDGWIGGGGWSTSARTSSLALRAVLGRSLDDLAQLRSELDGLRYYEAGVPWFATLFGRDALITALQSLAFDRDIAAETLRLLARRQGTRENAWRDEQPGKILHELRIGELARMGEIPHTPYYGTIDATPLFLIVLGRHAAWTGSLDLFTELADPVDAALRWLDDYADTDGDGFVDYRSSTGRGLVNQGWKDSGDAIVNASGDIAEPPIALCEVQGYTWRAWHEMAGLFERAGDGARAEQLRAKADSLRERFEERFWSDELGCYVLALADGSPCEVVTSNAGQVLWSGIASGEHARRVAERLMRPDMYTGWGIRTLSADARAFHPVGYHLGTVWPHDNSLIAGGFRRYGLDEAAERVLVGLLEAAQDFPAARLPECFSGFSRDRFPVPVRYPVACHPQAWAAGAIPDLLVTSLGLEPDGFAGELRVRCPRLPAGIEAVELRGVPVGAGTVHLRVQADGDRARLEVVETSGGVGVSTVDDPPSGRA